MNIQLRSEQNDPDFQPQQLLKKKLKNQKYITHNASVDKKNSADEKQFQKASSYRWKIQQHTKYVNFLIQRRDLFEMPLERKITLGIHNLMSKYVKNRSARQCRSHHQKMLAKHKSIDNIILDNQNLLCARNQTALTEIQKDEGEMKKGLQINQASQLQDFCDMEALPHIQSICEHYKLELKQIQSYQYEDCISLDFL